MSPLNDSVVGDEDDLYWKYFQFSWLLLILIFVLPSNFFVFISIRRRSSCFQPINVFQFNLVFSTLCYSIIVLPAVVITSYLSTWRFGNIFCWFSGFLSTIYFGGIMSSLGLTLLQKFFVIRHAHMCAFKHGWKAILAVGFVWTLQVLLASFPTIIQSNMEDEVYVFSATCFSCVPNWRFHKEFSIFWVFLSFLYPLAMIVFCGAYLFIYKLGKFRRVCAETSVRSSHYRLLPINLKSPSCRSTIDGSFPDNNYQDQETGFVTPRRLSKAGEDLNNQQVYQQQILPHSPITEESSTNLLSNFQVFSFDDKYGNENKVEGRRQNKRMIALNTEKSAIRTMKETKDLKKTAWKIILFMTTLLIFTAPFVIVFVMETLASDGEDSTNYNLPAYFGTFAALMFYSIPGFVVIFLIISDDHIRGVIHRKMRRCCGTKKKKDTSNDDIHLISTNMDLFEPDSTEALQQQEPQTSPCHIIQPPPSSSSNHRFHHNGLRKEIKLAWPSFSEDLPSLASSSSSSVESSNNIQYLCEDESSIEDDVFTSHQLKSAVSEHLLHMNSSGELMAMKSSCSLPANLSLMSSRSSLFVPNSTSSLLSAANTSVISRARSTSTWSVLSSRLSLPLDDDDENQQSGDSQVQIT